MPWLTVLIFLPLVGIPVLALWRGASDVQARAVALVVSLASFLVALGMLGSQVYNHLFSQIFALRAKIWEK